MNTILTSIEAAINSRPLTQDNGPEALTPAHILHGGCLTTTPTGPEPISTKSLTRGFRLKQQVAEDLEEVDERILVRTSDIPPGPTTMRRRNVMPRGRRCAPAGGGTTAPYVENGTGRGIATRKGWKSEDSHSPHPGRRASSMPSSAGHPLGG
jgi:hypothetical protein